MRVFVCVSLGYGWPLSGDRTQREMCVAVAVSTLFAASAHTNS